MNEETKLILQNQFHIMRYLWSSETCKIPSFEDAIHNQIKITLQVINPKEEQSLPEKTKDALGDKLE